MRIHLFSVFVLQLLLIGNDLLAQNPSTTRHEFWTLSGQGKIRWDVINEQRLPHADHIEMSGQKVSAIITYRIDENRMLRLERDVIFPQLRTYIKVSDPDWMNYRAYLRHVYSDDMSVPPISLLSRSFVPGPVDSVVIDGSVKFFHAASHGLVLTRKLFPSMTGRFFTEKWTLRNTSDSSRVITVGKSETLFREQGKDGTYTRRTLTSIEGDLTIDTTDEVSFYILYTAQLNDETERLDGKVAEQEREDYLTQIGGNLILETPDPTLNTMFHFAKIRASESIFDSKMGLVHSPGGGRYYTGVWANDQAEYANPFFPYLGYDVGRDAAMNAYTMFLKNIPPPGRKIWASFEMHGELPCCSHDRGDAAMIAFGASHFVMASGNRKYADQLWPLIDWSLKYSKSKTNASGVIASDSDELENRFPSGDANLATSSLHYGALVQAANLAKAMKKPYRQYLTEAKRLRTAIENHFGATIDGIETYRYYEGNTTLRSWICLPLVVGINERKEGTLSALLTKLWTDNGVKIEDDPDAKDQVFWDRGTLYAFRGAFKAGAADRALEKLHTYTTSRLLGPHVPYAVEAWPEGGMAHLSAESALYARIFTEGILSLEPNGFSSFSIQPNLPTKWSYLNIRNIKAFDSTFDILVKRHNKGYLVEIHQGGRIQSKEINEGEPMEVTLAR